MDEDAEDKEYGQEGKVHQLPSWYQYSVLVFLDLSHVSHKATHVYSKNVFVWGQWWGKEMI